MTSVRRSLMVLGAIGIAAFGWATRASAAVSCDGSWTDDRGQSSPTITFPNTSAYSPSQILISRGQTVVWKGNTSQDTFQKYPLVDASGKLWGTFSVNEQSWPFRYNQPGAWEYYNGAGTLPAMTMTGIVCVEGPPIASFTHSPSPAQPNQPVMFDASGSHAAASFASISDFQWDLGTGTFADNGTTPTTSHAFTKAGIYTVRLKVTDSLNTSTILTEQIPVGAVITQAPTLRSRTVKATTKGAVPLKVDNPNPVAASGKVTLTGSSGSGLSQIGSATFSAPANRATTVSVPLSSTARTYLKHHQSLRAKATIALSRNGTSKSSTWTITINRA